MADQQNTSLTLADRADVVALADRYLPLVGLPSYSALAAQVEHRNEVAAGRLEAQLGTAISEHRRLRVAHGQVSAEIDAAIAAFARGDAEAGMNLLVEAASFADHHAGLETGQPLPPGIAVLAHERSRRVARDLRRMS